MATWKPSFGTLPKARELYQKKTIFNYLSETIRGLEEYGGKIILLDISPENISSSCIRDLISKRQNPSNILDKSVYEYAKKNKLYLN